MSWRRSRVLVERGGGGGGVETREKMRYTNKTVSGHAKGTMHCHALIWSDITYTNYCFSFMTSKLFLKNEETASVN